MILLHSVCLFVGLSWPFVCFAVSVDTVALTLSRKCQGEAEENHDKLRMHG
jgi:hypothetical protein